MNILAFSESPFDKIRRVDESGNEYWLARELMPLLGYQKWERFEGSIDRARVACQNSGFDAKEHFFPETGKTTGGRPGSDYRLSRHACYLTTMNGDPKKPEIALAQSYFAIKTQEAETSTKAQTANAASSPTYFLEVARSILNQVESQFSQMQQNQRALFAMLQHQEQLQNQVNQIEETVNEVQFVQAEAKAELEKIDLPEIPVQQMTDRKKITWLIETYVRKTGVNRVEVWNEVYRQFGYRYSINLKTRANNETKRLEEQGKKTKIKAMDVLESLRMCKEFYAIAYEILVSTLGSDHS